MTITLKRLGDIATYVNGYAFKPTDWKNKGLPIIRIQNLTNPDSPFNYYQGEIDDKYIVNKGDILISWSASLGVFEWLGEKAVLNQHIFKVIFDKEDIDKSYFKYIVQRSLERALKYLHGSTMKHITKKYFDNILVPIPDLVTQKKIAKVLDKAQELIDKRKAQIEALDQLTQSLFLEMFGDPVKNSLGFKTEPLHELCVHIFGGGTPSKSNPEYYIGNIPWVTPKDMKDIVINDSIDHINEDAIANSSAKLIPPNSLLMVIRSGILKKKLPIAINTREVTVNQDMKAFVVDKNKITVEYLLYFFEFYQKVLLNRVRSVTADNLDFQQIKEILVPVPPINKQKEFSNIFYKVLAEKNKCLQQLNELENNFNSLMQRAFKGELFND
ncbi:restriction endonuclease subunit S [Caldibacillus debilis]|uniref:Type I restriction-modification system, specificity subunit S n=1 Tax=Caldibacillus debilis TaxID=301148 RepID=A0A150LL96_9BACI|nr:restriction endonuclease subunit S [Caldibacillus debilis]KYD12990.1 Type I restriction-modification system, specificity subunit S [Caldibacillus debilis]